MAYFLNMKPLGVQFMYPLLNLRASMPPNTNHIIPTMKIMRANTFVAVPLVNDVFVRTPIAARGTRELKMKIAIDSFPRISRECI